MNSKQRIPQRSNLLRELCSRRNLPFFFLLGLSCVALLAFTRWEMFPSSAILMDADARDLRRIQSSEALRLLLASHGRLMWYFPGNDSTLVLHEGEGVHYGSFPGERDPSGQLKTLWNVIRPHNWRPQTSEEHLVEFDAASGAELRRVLIDSSFTHDAVRFEDRVFVCSTGEGTILELAYPDMKMVNTIPQFTLREHINTLCPQGESGNQLLVMLHNLGLSDIVRLNIDPKIDPSDVREQPTGDRIKGVGSKCHGLVEWRDALIFLDSENGALRAIPNYKANSGAETELVWQAPDKGKFLKGLAVVDDIAYFGVSVWSKRSQRDAEGADSELAAVNLVDHTLLFRRKVPTHGLLNIVAAPQLGDASTYRGMSSLSGLAMSMAASQELSHSSSTAGGAAATDATTTALDASSMADAAPTDLKCNYDDCGVCQGEEAGDFDDIFAKHGVLHRVSKLRKEGYAPAVGGLWASGLPYFPIKGKNCKHPNSIGIQLPLFQLEEETLLKIKEEVLSIPDYDWTNAGAKENNAVVGGREDNMATFKPGCGAVYLVFSDRSTMNTYRYPYYYKFKDLLEPLVKRIVGPDGVNRIVRLQFARMPPGAQILRHKDMGGYAHKSHRIHIPVVTHDSVAFQVKAGSGDTWLRDHADKDEDIKEMLLHNQQEPGFVDISMDAGYVSEINNVLPHRVNNTSPVTRIHLVLDVSSDKTLPLWELKKGAICEYVHSDVKCPEGMMAPLR